MKPGPKRGAPNAGRPNRSGIDWSDPIQRKAYFQERRAAYASGEQVKQHLGRSRTEAAYTIQVKYHARSYSYRVHIGKSLYEAIGSPSSVELEIYRSGILIRGCAPTRSKAYSVDGPKRNTTPIFSVGEEELSRFGLTVGTYHAAAVNEQDICIARKELARVLYRGD